jgi:hypothetical protein
MINIQASGTSSFQRIAPRDPAPDQLSALLRAALRAQVAQAQPSPGTWDRIRQRIAKKGPGLTTRGCAQPKVTVPGDGRLA